MPHRQRVSRLRSADDAYDVPRVHHEAGVVLEVDAHQVGVGVVGRRERRGADVLVAGDPTQPVEPGREADERRRPVVEKPAADLPLHRTYVLRPGGQHLAGAELDRQGPLGTDAVAQVDSRARETRPARWIGLCIRLTSGISTK